MKAKLQSPPPEAIALLREAATLGPGHRGRRRAASPSERAEIRDRLSSLGVEPPVFLDRDQAWVDRRAKLFETGDYHDKGVSVSADDLTRLTETFDLPVPVLIEHAKSPLQIGFLTDVSQDGNELFGNLALTREANELIEASQAHGLSLGLSPGLNEIQEVSLVKNPRVATARMFTGEVLLETMDWKAECERLAQRQALSEATARIEALVADGRLLPAQVPFAMALAQVPASVQFDGETAPVGSLVMALLEHGPRHTLLHEHAHAPADQAPGLNPDERAFYDRYFAGLSLQEIARNRSHNPTPTT